MKCLRGLAFLLGTVFAMSANAALYNFNSGFANNGIIPDGNATGWSDTRTVSGWQSGWSISDVNVSFQVSGGYNGDLYAYLSYAPSGGGPGGFVVLLNRIGRDTQSSFGSGSSGFGPGFTLDDQATLNGNIHNYNLNVAPTGSWQPDGRNVDPRFAVTGDTPTTSLSSFNGLNANGQWTLFFADMSGGDQSQLTGWSLQIEAIPEPANVALAAFGLGAVGVGLIRRWRKN